MIKLVCPACGWSDFIRYDHDDTLYCMCCRLEYTDVRMLEKEVPDSEYDGYGLTLVISDDDDEEFYDELLTHYDEYWAGYMEADRFSSDGTESQDEADWQILDGPSPFEEK